MQVDLDTSKSGNRTSREPRNGKSAVADGGQYVRLAKTAIKVLAVGALLLLALYRLTDYPTIWFDEGSHLQVPKALVQHGVYAAPSSDGYRYYGPTVGLGPTVMLPIAAAFRLFGIGLLQARLVMVAYLLGAVYAMYYLARAFGGRWLAWVCCALLVSTRGAFLLGYGRQVLGEVPGLLFLALGLALWLSAGERPSMRRLLLAGVLLGLATITKHQYLLVILPGLGVAWMLGVIYYRSADTRSYLVLGVAAGLVFGLWQAIMVLYLGPATAAENLAMLREATAGAALVFSPALMRESVGQLLSLRVYLGWLVPGLIYGATLALPRTREGQRWSVILSMVAANLIWYAVASVGWLRYAFPGLALSSLFLGRLATDVISAGAPYRGIRTVRERRPLDISGRLALLATVWLTLMVVVPLAQTLREAVTIDSGAARQMAGFMNREVPLDVLVETWEPEMGFLTDHLYHYPPPLLLNDAVVYVSTGGVPPSERYAFVSEAQPPYVLVGEFARWVGLYPPDVLEQQYVRVTTAGAYELYAHKP